MSPAAPSPTQLDADLAVTPAQAAARRAPGTIRVTLQYPITVDGRKITHLDVRRPKARDVLHADSLGGSDAMKEISVFASLAGVEPDLIEQLDMADYLQLQGVYKGFLS